MLLAWVDSSVYYLEYLTVDYIVEWWLVLTNHLLRHASWYSYILHLFMLATHFHVLEISLLTLHEISYPPSHAYAHQLVAKYPLPIYTNIVIPLSDDLNKTL